MQPILSPKSTSSDLLTQSAEGTEDKLSITIEIVTLDIPSETVLSQAFDKIRTLPNYLKPIVMEGLAKKLGVGKKTIDKSFELWMMERISQMVLTGSGQNNSNNGEEV